MASREVRLDPLHDWVDLKNPPRALAIFNRALSHANKLELSVPDCNHGGSAVPSAVLGAQGESTPGGDGQTFSGGMR